MVLYVFVAVGTFLILVCSILRVKMLERVYTMDLVKKVSVRVC